METLLPMLASVIGAGGLATIITALVNKKKTDAEAKNSHIESLLKIDDRVSARLARLEERVAHLETENARYREENLNLKEEIFRLSRARHP